MKAISVLNVLLLLVFVYLAGCAHEGFIGLCGIFPMGQTDSGILVAKVACDPE